jgi:hypothetical protein
MARHRLCYPYQFQPSAGAGGNHFSLLCFRFAHSPAWFQMPFFASSQSDTISVAPTSAKLKLHSPGHRLYFPAGALSIQDYGASITFSRGVEFIIKFE